MHCTDFDVNKFLFLVLHSLQQSLGCHNDCNIFRLSVAASTHRLSAAAVFAHENLQAITNKFADFQTKVCDRLLTKEINMEQFRLFVKNQFPPGDCIPPPPASLTDIFEAITYHGLWDYFHYSPLVRIATKFGAGDPEIESWIETYLKDLKAFTMVATLEDYIEDELDVTELEVTDLPPAKRAKYNPLYHCRMKWKTKFIDHSLQYLADVWKLFSCRYLVPDSPSTALLDHVQLHGLFHHTSSQYLLKEWMMTLTFFSNIIF